jgi:deoxyribonuclease V
LLFTHAWNVSPAEARAIQDRLREQVRIEPLDASRMATVAGADLSSERGSGVVYAGVVLLRLPSLEVAEQAGVRAMVSFPYVPGLLSFREVPPLLEAWQALRARPDALICDGQGLAHPRRCGFACHLGLLLDLPTVGCAKSLLVGQFEPPGPQRGDWAPILHRGETVGAALRTRDGVAPVFVSIGHRCDLLSAIDLVLRCAPRTRLPETTRAAHQFVNTLRRSEQEL